MAGELQQELRDIDRNRSIELEKEEIFIKAITLVEGLKDSITKRYKWEGNEKTILKLLILWYKSKLNINIFAEKIKLNNGYLYYFSQGRRCDGRSWKKLICEIILGMPKEFVFDMLFEINKEDANKSYHD